MPSRESDRASPPFGVYVHVPFCSVRCTYCDFATVTGRDGEIDRYLDALEREIGAFAGDGSIAADTVFVGGGTPSRMSPHQAGRVVEAVRRRFRLRTDAEITLEANPEDLPADRLAGYREAGYNRISIGVQSFDDAVLRRVGRGHDASAAGAAVRRARSAGFDNVNLDLIAGLPGEDLARWPVALARAIELEPEHVSVYLLETDKSTPLSRAVLSGRTSLVDGETLAAAYERTVRVLEESGRLQYEISNFALDGRRSRHNLKYWTDAPFAGFGLAAHGYRDGERTANRSDLAGYLSALASGTDAIAWSDAFDAERRSSEALVFGLRLNDGVDLRVLGRRYGVDLAVRFGRVWDRAIEDGLVTREADRVRLTATGRLHANVVFADLI